MIARIKKFFDDRRHAREVEERLVPVLAMFREAIKQGNHRKIATMVNALGGAALLLVLNRLDPVERVLVLTATHMAADDRPNPP